MVLVQRLRVATSASTKLLLRSLSIPLDLTLVTFGDLKAPLLKYPQAYTQGLLGHRSRPWTEDIKPRSTTSQPLNYILNPKNSQARHMGGKMDDITVVVGMVVKV